MHTEATFAVKSGLAEMLKGGVIMDVVTPDQAALAEDAGAAAVMALERVPADIRRDGGVARMSDPEMIGGIQQAVSIPVMAKARIGHFMKALGAEGVFVGSGIFKSDDPPARARAIVQATTHWQDPEQIAAASRGLGAAMASLETSKLEHEQLLAQRGW